MVHGVRERRGTPAAVRVDDGTRVHLSLLENLIHCFIDLKSSTKPSLQLDLCGTLFGLAQDPVSRVRRWPTRVRHEEYGDGLVRRRCVRSDGAVHQLAGFRRSGPSRLVELDERRRIFAQRQMSPRSLVVFEVRFQDSAQTGFIQDDHMIQALATDRTDQAARRRRSAKGIAVP